MRRSTIFLTLLTLSLLLAGCKPVRSKVVSVTPSAGEIVTVEQMTIEVTFDRQMQSATINSSNFTVTGSESGSHLGAILYDNTTLTATFASEQPFVEGEMVTVVLTDEIRSVSQKDLKGFVSTFTIHQDPIIPPTPFELQAARPAIESVDAPVLTAVELEYSSPFNPFSVGASTIQVVGSRSGARTLTFDNIFGGTGNIRLTVDRGFLPGERVHVAVHSLTSIEGVDAAPALIAFSIANLASEWPTGALAQGAVDSDSIILFFDADRDGRDEWAVVDPSGALLLQETNAGTPSVPNTRVLPDGVLAAEAADFDGDGQVDLALLAASGDRVFLLRGTGDAALVGGVETIELSSFIASDLSVGHFDDDSQPDLFLVAQASENGALLLRGDATFPFSTQVELPRLAALSPAVAADFSGDNLPDLACAVNGGRVQILFGRGDATFEDGPLIETAATIAGLALGNFDGDGFADLVCYAGSGVAGSLLLTNEDGTFTETRLPEDASATSTQIADWNGDSRLDLLALTDSTTIQRFPGFGDGTFGPAETETIDAPAESLRLGDVNGDGSLDVGLILSSGEFQVSHGTTASPTIANTMRVEDFEAAAGDTNVPFVVSADHNVTLDGFTVVLSYDPTIVTLDSLTTLGTDVGGIGVEFEIPQINGSGFAILAAIFDFLPPYDGQTLAAGEDNVLVIGRLSVDAGASAGTTRINPENGLGSPPSDNSFVVAGVTVDPALEAGTLTVTASTPPPPSGPEFIRGDVNGDDLVNIADGTALIEFLFGGGTTPPCLDAADVNDDSVIDISDNTFLNDFLFGTGSTPPAPFPAAGVDLTPDGLSCGV